MEFAFAHKMSCARLFKKRAHDPNALYDAYDESDDTEETQKRVLEGRGKIRKCRRRTGILWRDDGA